MKGLSLDHVSVRFGQVQALDDVSLALGAGEVAMLVGPNGAGKSTLIRVLLGLVRPDAGALRVDGNARSVDNAFKTHLGYLPEAVAFAENLGGRQVLSFFAAARGVSKRRVDAVLERVGLTHAARRAVRGYSRGMRQRLGLGISLLSEPQLLILDEPTGGLDQEGLTVLWSVLSEWRAAGRMVLMASHDLTLLERRVNRICVLKNGRVLADDSATGLRSLVALPITVVIGLDGDIGATDALVDLIAAKNPGASVHRGPSQLEIQVAPAELLPMLSTAIDAPGVASVRVLEPGLDDVYEHLLGGSP